MTHWELASAHHYHNTPSQLIRQPFLNRKFIAFDCRQHGVADAFIGSMYCYAVERLHRDVSSSLVASTLLLAQRIMGNAMLITLLYYKPFLCCNVLLRHDCNVILSIIPLDLILNAMRII